MIDSVAVDQIIVFKQFKQTVNVLDTLYWNSDWHVWLF